MWPEVLRGGIVPFAAAAATWLVLARPWRRTGAPAAFPFAAGALAIGLGMAAGYVALYGLPAWPIREHWRRMAVVIAAATVVAAGTSWRRPPRWLDALVGATASALLAWLLVPSFADLEETRTTWRLALGVILAASWIALGNIHGGESDRPLVSLIGLTIAAMATAGVLVQAGNARLAQLAGASGAAAGALAAAALWRPALVARGPVLRAAALPLAGLALLGKFYDSAGMPTASFVLVALAFPALGLADLLPLPAKRRRWREVARLATVLVLSGGAVALTLGRSAEEVPYY